MSGTHTPWGAADQARKLAPGIMQYQTPSHGGIHLSPSRQAKMPPALQRSGGWYEEDCEWALAAFVFPDAFDPDVAAQADQTVRDWYPDDYTAATGVTLTAATSQTLREREAHVQYHDQYVTVAAWGDWHRNVPAGMVGVCAVRGGRNEAGRYASTDEKYFLVPSAEYDAPRAVPIGFPIDEGRHTSWAGPDRQEGERP